LIVIVRLPWRGPEIMESLSQYLGAAQDVEIWATHAAHDTIGFLLAVTVTAILLLLITYIFIPIGQTVSRQIELAPRPLYGYSWNLAGSLAASSHSLPSPGWRCRRQYGSRSFWRAWRCFNPNRSNAIWIAAAILPVALAPLRSFDASPLQPLDSLSADRSGGFSLSEWRTRPYFDPRQPHRLPDREQSFSPTFWLATPAY
jgi:hypothetical protein